MMMAGYMAWWGTPAQVELAVEIAAAGAVASNNPAVQMWKVWIDGLAAGAAGRHDDAIAAFRHCLELCTIAGHRAMESASGLFMGRDMLAAGRIIMPDEDRLILRTVRKNRTTVGSALANLARRLAANGRVEEAVVLLGYSRRHFEDTALMAMQATLDEISAEADAAPWLAHGASLDHDAIFDYALATLDRIESAAR